MMHTRTEQATAPNFWKWILFWFGVIFLIALTAAGVFYFLRGQSDSHPRNEQGILWMDQRSPRASTWISRSWK